MKALVVGGGIAGPATAMALHQVGIEAVVLESRAHIDRDAGSYLGLAPNGLSALDAIGALDLAHSVGTSTRSHVMFGATGRRLGTLTAGTPLADGTQALTMKRSHLGWLLTAEARARGIEVREDAKVVSARTDRDHASVQLADGSELTADLVIGADGVHSKVRRAIDADAPTPRFVGLTNFGGITRDTALAAELPEESWSFIFGRRSFFGAHPTPDGDVVWFVNVPEPEITTERRASTSLDQWQQHLAELASVDAGPARALIESGELELAGDNTYDLPHVPVWHRGRLAILGDALHAPSPSSGQGASMALEDAVVMAASLRDSDSEAGAFAAFESARRARVERIVAVGARSSSSKIPGRIGRVPMEAMMRLVFRYLVTERGQSWMTGHRVHLGANQRL
ncbi:FAD-dependent oxidoreductase [Pedococcus bigeumensis]|uniref:FAD-dependent monooxygenase n=1 Tax=Pedococcus bigeumensis TaxID=433644 RepID=A0A502CXJ6_9MICO|nr:FAD-dependent monooxygenase [Pedococcus bigeumensis]TPG17250.1 FAD-dependent monooxygenase [Pedococcus bigeumensis]